MATIDKSSVFATGPAGTSGIDSLTLGGGSLWAEYGNGADSTGANGSSTIVQYSLSGQIEYSTTISGSVDGLKIDPATGLVWALQNQDGNSTLSLIDPMTHTVSDPLSYVQASATRGYDDVAFGNDGRVYLSYTNPNGSGDPVVQMLNGGDFNPSGKLGVTDILADGATGTNIATGQVETIPLNDPDSLKSTPDGGLVLSSEADDTIVLVSHPGAANQSERFVTMQNVPAGKLDDVVIPTSTSGTFTVANAGTNQIETYTLSGLNMSDAYASVGSEIVKVDLQTGVTTPVITGLSSSHGMVFTPTDVVNPVVQSTKIFAVGGEADATAPDSVAMDDSGNTFIEYGNGADSTGLLANGGSSTIVEYDAIGRIEQSTTIPGNEDGLKYNPSTGQIWALHNQDGNSSIYLIDPQTFSVSAPLAYAAPYVYGANSSRGYDDVAFDNGQVYLSYTNPAHIGDSVVQQLDNGNSPSGTLHTTSIVRLGDTGTNLTTGAVNQPLPVGDPDSLKALDDGTLILTSDHDAALTFIYNPGTAQQTESFVNLPAGSTGLDDAIVPTSASGTFYVSNLGANDVLKVAVTGLNTSDIYISVGSENAVVQIDPNTGAATPIITGLNAPHGVMFVPSGTSPAVAAPSLSALAQSVAQGLQKDFSANILPTTKQTAASVGGSDPMLRQQVGSLTSILPDPSSSRAAALPLAHGIHQV